MDKVEHIISMSENKSIEEIAHKYTKEVFGKYDPELQQEFDDFKNHLISFAGTFDQEGFALCAVLKLKPRFIITKRDGNE